MTPRRAPGAKTKSLRSGRAPVARDAAPRGGHSHAGDDETRERLMKTALRLFGERGFSKVTVRDICHHAEANVAAVSYHFGDKLGLYKEVVRHALTTLKHLHDEPLSAPAGASAEERLRHYVRSYLPLLVRPRGDTEAIQKLMRQEMAEPTPAARWIFEQVVMPRIKYLSRVMAELLDCPEDDERVTVRCVVSVQAQCLFYLRDPFKIAVIPGWAPADDAAIAAIADHVAEFSLAGVRAMRTLISQQRVVSMDDGLAALFNEFDRGEQSPGADCSRCSKLAAVAAPMAAFGQGSCGGANAGTARCDTMPFKPPFEPTGWQTVLMDHFSVQCADYEKEAAYFNALMGWKVRSDDGTKAVLDIGDWGGIVIRGGLEDLTRATPTTGTMALPAPVGLAANVAVAAAGAVASRAQCGTASAGAFSKWDTTKVEAELKRRGLNPVADHDGKDFQSFHVKDPDGFDRPGSATARARIGEPRPANGAACRPRTVRAHRLENDVARSHLLQCDELQGIRRLLRGATRLEVDLGDEGSPQL